MDADSLAADLHNHLHWWLAECPGSARRSMRWVMDRSWLNEVRKIELADGRTWWAFMPPIEVADPELLLGIPVNIRERDDRPGWMWRVPHLEMAP